MNSWIIKWCDGYTLKSLTVHEYDPYYALQNNAWRWNSNPSCLISVERVPEIQT